MECRVGCAACCIAPSISSPLPKMPQGKPAMTPCAHLTEDYRCELFGKKERPKVCGGFKAEPDFCGRDRDEGIRILSSLE
ncbi:YkgJ family cysteine cluster protein [Saccharicrinis fermentans]|uniref:Flagellin N-methylase n=1 Tax=Saccharicrinis fermentans DSM 9555 = JCM 21142 TaxID=869213 RepID=W7YPQ4_9BACT|nr:YkgJ family cysteine cluster protein [Saccharicrinis fermentans]GAF04404.1 hypothetical protein JCM21142_83108 [Saccharicrinis fermentans DSM 9555 = JCM 21142]